MATTISYKLVYDQIQQADSTSVVIMQDQNGNVLGFVPNDPKNRDWTAYQAWLAKGNTPAASTKPTATTTTTSS